MGDDLAFEDVNGAGVVFDIESEFGAEIFEFHAGSVQEEALGSGWYVNADAAGEAAGLP